MAQLNFPDPADTQEFEAAGILWTWNATLGVWSSETTTAFDAGELYLSKRNDDAADGNIDFRGLTTHQQGVQLPNLTNAGALATDVDGNIIAGTGSGSGDEFLSSVNDDTAQGEITFEKKTRHEGGVQVTGGSIDDVFTGLYVSGGDLITTNRQFRVAQFGNADKSIGISCNPNGKMSNTEGLAINLIESTYGYGSHGVQDLSLFRGAYTANTNCKGSTNCFTAEFRVNQTGADNRAVGFYSKVNSGDSLNGPAYGFYAEGDAPNYFAGQLFAQPNSRNVAYWTNIDKGFLKTYAANGAIVGSGDKDSAPIQVSVGANWSTTKHLFSVQSGLGSGGSICTASGGDLGFNNTSDYRIKTNIQDYSKNASEKIKALRLVSYTRTDFDIDVPIGFIAHELQEQVPEAVFGEKDAVAAIGTLTDWDGTELETEVIEPEELTYTEKVETEGVATMVTRTRSWNQTGTRDVYQGVDQTKLIPLLTKALQEALERIEVLEQEHAAMQGTSTTDSGPSSAY